MRQTQILRSPKRRRAAETAAVRIPTAPAADTTDAALLIAAIDVLLASDPES